MATLRHGQWWRISEQATAARALRACVIAPTRTIFVGEESGLAVIRHVPTADLTQLAPTYTAATPAGTDALFGVAHIETEDIVAAVGLNGRIEESTDQGLTWSGQNVTANPLLWDIVGVSGDASSRFIAVGNNRIWGQDNLGTWSQRWSGSQQYFGVAYLNGVGWLAVGKTGGAALSTDGVTWPSPYNIATVATISKVRANSTYFMAIGSNGSIYRSSTGLSGSWEIKSLGVPVNLRAIAPTRPDNWAILDDDGRGWTTTDNGDTWEENQVTTLYGPLGMDKVGLSAVACGFNGVAYVSYVQAQADYVAPEVDLEQPEDAFADNDKIAGDAVKRLLTQFRSGRG